MAREVPIDGTWDPFGPSTVAVFLLSILVLQNAWSSAPQWLRRGILKNADDEHETNGKKKDTRTKRTSIADIATGSAGNDLTNPINLLEKLSTMSKLARELCADDTTEEGADRWETMPKHTYYCCFLSMLHLMHELDVHYPEFRQGIYEKEGDIVTEKELECLLQWLDFATWAYLDTIQELQDKLRDRKYELVRLDTTTEPGRVGHFIAVHHEEKRVVISLKGTSTLGDIATDVLGKAIPHTIDESGKGWGLGWNIGIQPKKKIEIRCHEGMYTAACIMLQDTLHLLQHWIEPQGYSVIICGHSLGAAVACLLGVLIKQVMPNLNMHVYAYATPVCLSLDASLGCCNYVTSVVNNHDIVPRMSLLNLRLLNKLFMLIDSKLNEKGMSPDNMTTAAAYVKDLLKVDDELLLTPEEITDFFKQHLVDNAEHKRGEVNEKLLDIELFVPGRVVSLWVKDEPKNIDIQDVVDEDTKQEEEGASTDKQEANKDEGNTTVTSATPKEEEVGGRALNGMMQVLRMIMMAEDMVSDHSCVAYQKNLQQLLKQTKEAV